jgi:hypothetical protein
MDVMGGLQNSFAIRCGFAAYAAASQTRRNG